MENLRARLKWRFVRAMQIWNRLPIRAQGGVTVLIPIIAVLISFGFAIYGNQTREAIGNDIQRKFKAVRQYSDLLTLMIDAETGERGFLLTRRDEYFEPYKKAADEIPQTIEQLKQTIEAEPGDKPRAERIIGLAKIQELINQQLASLKTSQDFVESGKANQEELNEHLQRGKRLMDEIRAQIGAMQNKEQTLLAERVEQINSIRNRDYIVIFVTLMLGVLVRIISFYLFDRGIVRRINRLAEYASSISKNEPNKYVPSKKTDALGMLENEIIQLAGQIENKLNTPNR